MHLKGNIVSKKTSKEVSAKTHKPLVITPNQIEIGLNIIAMAKRYPHEKRDDKNLNLTEQERFKLRYNWATSKCLPNRKFYSTLPKGVLSFIALHFAALRRIKKRTNQKQPLIAKETEAPVKEVDVEVWKMRLLNTLKKNLPERKRELKRTDRPPFEND